MTTKEREEVISILSAEGVPLDTTRALLRAGATLHRLAELECSSEAADRDRVPCPGGAEHCLCRDYGSHDPHRAEFVTCGACHRTWCGKCDPAPSALCHWCHGRGRSTHPVKDDDARCQHGTVPRIMVQEAQTRRRVERICTDAGLSARFGGDPRGAVLLVAVPSGRTNDWGKRGIVVG